MSETEAKAVAEQITMAFEEAWVALCRARPQEPMFDVLDAISECAAFEAIHALDDFRAAPVSEDDPDA